METLLFLWYIILGVDLTGPWMPRYQLKHSFWVFLWESFWERLTFELADWEQKAPPQCGWATSDPLRAWTEQKTEERWILSPGLFELSYWSSLVLRSGLNLQFPWTSGLQIQTEFNASGSPGCSVYSLQTWNLTAIFEILSASYFIFLCVYLCVHMHIYVFVGMYIFLTLQWTLYNLLQKQSWLRLSSIFYVLSTYQPINHDAYVYMCYRYTHIYGESTRQGSPTISSSYKRGRGQPLPLSLSKKTNPANT